MTHNTLKTKLGRNVIVESFKSFSEMVETNETRESNFGYNREIEGRDFDFKSYEEAKAWLFNYDKHLNKFKTAFKNVDKNKTVEVKKTVNRVGVAGFQPLIPNALMGLPNSMIRTDVVSKKSKIINVMIDATYKWSTKGYEVAEKFSKALAYLAGLEKQGFRVRLTLMFVFGEGRSSDQIHVAKVNLKSENQPIDLKRLMFPLTNLGSFRLFGWDWYERLPKAEQIGGYGQAVYHWNQVKQNDLLESIGDPNSKAYVLHMENDVYEVFKDVR